MLLCHGDHYVSQFILAWNRHKSNAGLHTTVAWLSIP